MPLVDLKTSLKDLKFGMDRVGGGNSGQPYETFPIPDNNTTPLITDFWQNNDTSLDYPIRGGALIGAAGAPNYTISSQIDKDRIQKFLNDAPRGPQFIQKQQGLIASNPIMETGSPSAVYNGLQGLLGLGNQMPYTPTGYNNQYYNKGRSLLAQVLSSGVGIHVPYNGSNVPIDTNAQYYTDVVGQQRYITGDLTDINRLLMLQKSKLISGNSTNQTVTISDNASSLGISNKTSILFDYPGGPGSSYGIGNTTINRAVNSSDAYNLTKDHSTLFPNVFTMTYQQLMTASNNTAGTLASRGKDRNSTILTDFRKATIDPTGSQFWDKSSSVDVRFYLSGSDKMNSDLTFLKLVDNTNYDPFANIEKSEPNDDMIKFGFECMSNDNPGQSVPLFFRAFLTKGISDNHQAELNSFKYMGRGETFHTYQGFNRSISFGFRIVVFSQSEMIPLYNKLNYLVSQVYPDYSPQTSVMRASLVKVTIGDYIYRMPGFLGSVNLSIDEGTTWEINVDRSEGVYQLPKMVNVDIDFKPIFSELPQRVSIDSKGNSSGAAIIGWRGNKNDFINVSQTVQQSVQNSGNPSESNITVTTNRPLTPAI